MDFDKATQDSIIPMQKFDESWSTESPEQREHALKELRACYRFASKHVEAAKIALEARDDFAFARAMTAFSVIYSNAVLRSMFPDDMPPDAPKVGLK